jgi:hypothetical protein
LGSDIGLQAPQVGSQTFCIHDRLRNQPEVAPNLIADGKFVAYVEIETHGPLLYPSGLIVCDAAARQLICVNRPALTISALRQINIIAARVA